MSIIALGINHKTAPVDLRERVAFAPDSIEKALQSLVNQTGCKEAVILSTCNRTELYCSGSDDVKAVISWLGEFHQCRQDELNPFTYAFENEAATRHLMRVATGLDSLVLGEPQILGQIKQAYNSARESGTISMMLEKLFQKTFSVAKQVRTETEIGANAVSVAFASVNLAKHIFGSLANARVLLIGAGETIELVARHLKENSAADISVANRTLARAELLADQIGGKVLSLADIPERLADADIVISSTASTLPVIGKGMVEDALKARRYKPMFFVDLAVPRDIEGQVADLDDAYLYTVDDLQAIVEQNIQSRQQAANQAESIIDVKSKEFSAMLRSLDSVDLIKDYRESSHSVREELVMRALSQLEQGKNAESVISELANKLTNRLIHAPTSAMKVAAENGEQEKLHLIKDVLGIK